MYGLVTGDRSMFFLLSLEREDLLALIGCGSNQRTPAFFIQDAMVSVPV